MTAASTRKRAIREAWYEELGRAEARREQLGTQFGSFRAALLASTHPAFPVCLP